MMQLHLVQVEQDCTENKYIIKLYTDDGKNYLIHNGMSYSHAALLGQQLANSLNCHFETIP